MSPGATAVAVAAPKVAITFTPDKRIVYFTTKAMQPDVTFFFFSFANSSLNKPLRAPQSLLGQTSRHRQQARARAASIAYYRDRDR